MTDAIRHDAVPLRATRSPEGYLRDAPIIARTGVQTYRMGNKFVREYKGPEVYDAVALAAIQGLPLIDTHAAAITSANVREHIIGTVLSPGRLDGTQVAADVIVYDEVPVKAGRKELSLAYAVAVDETPGTAPDGSPYDQRVTAIRRFDHLATVERGRAGIARLRVDSANDAISADLASEDLPPPPPAAPVPPANNRKEGQTMAETPLPPLVQVRLDGVTVGVTQDIANAIERLRADAATAADKARADVEAANRRVDEATATGTKRADEAATALAAAEAARDAEKARADAAEARISVAQAEAAAAARARVELEATAKGHGVDVRADASDSDLQAAVILKLSPNANLSGKDAKGIAARFDAEIDRLGVKHANAAAQTAQATPAAAVATAPTVRADAASIPSVARSAADVARAMAAAGQ